MDEFQTYLRTSISELRPVTDAEIQTKVLAPYISLSQADREAGSPLPGDMIARNPKNHKDQWLVAKKYFEENFD